MSVMIAAASLMAVGTGLQAYGQYTNLLAESKSLKYRSEIAANNATLANMEAAQRRSQGNIDYTRYRLFVARQLSRQKTAFTASGVDISGGTPAEVISDTAAIGETEALTIRHNSLMDVWQLRNQATGFEAESSLLAERAKQARRQAPLAAFGTLLGGAGSALGVSKYGSSK